MEDRHETMKIRVISSLTLITTAKYPVPHTLGPGVYDCEKSGPPLGYNPSGGDWIYHKIDGAVTVGCNVNSLNGAEILE